MTKKNVILEKKDPTVTKQQGLVLIKRRIDKGKEILSRTPFSEESNSIWYEATLEDLDKVYGSPNPYRDGFIGPIFGAVAIPRGWTPPSESEITMEQIKKLKKRIRFLEELLSELENDITLETELASPVPEGNDDFWPLLHVSVRGVAKQRFDDGHYADAVEAALKELNAKVKELVKRKTTEEWDGAKLMRRAFSPDDPQIVLDDLSTQSGKDVQQGYMEIFAGTMIGIRNPKAHANLHTTKEWAIHHLFLASLLFKAVDERF